MGAAVVESASGPSVDRMEVAKGTEKPAQLLFSKLLNGLKWGFNARSLVIPVAASQASAGLAVAAAAPAPTSAAREAAAA